VLALGIESSCDETAVAVVEDGWRVRSSLIASQVAAHARFGGVVPEVAAREHLKAIDPLLRAALTEAGVTPGALDAVIVTQGPGLIGALLVGVAYAKGLALTLGKPLVPVDHVHAHVHGALLGVEREKHADLWPTLALVVSGGHTNLYRMTGPTDYALLGASDDDACGECFDKTAKLLGLAYPGGPLIEKLARGGDAKRVTMPKMVPARASLDFSYAGLKTFMANTIRTETAGGTKPMDEQRRADLCASFQEEALGQIVRKVSEAARRYPDTRSVLVAGGVAANQRFRALLAEQVRVPSLFPHPSYCADNAAMIAAYGTRVYEARVDDGQALPARFGPPHDWDAYSRYDYAAHSVGTE
jgi:N6-L-threonylcarbamoyladenine synthase